MADRIHNAFLAALIGASLFVPAQAIAQSANPLLPDSLSAAPLQTNAAPVAVKAAFSPVTLVPFTEPASRFRLSGESDVSEFTFRIGKDQAAVGGELVIAYKNAVSILPDDGRVKVELNGKPAGDFSIVSPFDFTRQSIKVHAQALKVGVNTVRLTVTQHHRVDCSLKATYELWTDVSPSLSGFKPAQAPRFATMDDLFAAGRQDNGITDLRVVLPGKPDAALLKSASDIVQALGLYLDRQDMAVTVADRPGEGPGIDLYLDIAGQTPSPEAAALSLAPAGVSVQPGFAAGRASLIFKAANREDLDGLLVAAVKGPMMTGLRDMRNRPRFGEIRVAAGQKFTLRDVGLRSQTFAGRMMRTHFDMIMPADFYPAEYGTLDLTLDAATAPGLEPSSQMLVRVNGAVVNALPFRNTDGQNFNGKLIRLPLRAFRPGVNQVEMLAELPKPSDAACAPAGRDESKPRYVLLDKTSFQTPELARVTRLPDLAAFASNGYPYASGKPFGVYLETADASSSGAALTVLARLAQASGLPLQADIRLGTPLKDTPGDQLILASSFDSEDATADAAAETSDNAGVADHSDVAEQSTAAIAMDSDGQANNQLISAFRQSSANEANELSFTTRAAAFADRLGARFRSWLKYEDPKSVDISTDGALITVAQVASKGASGAVTEIRGGSPEDLALGVRRLTSPDVWAQLNGGAAVISSDQLALATTPAVETTFQDVTEQSVGNYRRITAAWLSDHFQIYVGLVIGLVIVFAAWLGFTVQRKGVRTAK